MAQRNQKFSATSSKKSNVVSKSTSAKSSSTIDNTANELKEEEGLTEKEQFQICENFIVFWLDSSSKSLNESAISQIRSIVNIIKSFNNINECIKSIVEIKDEKIFLIVSNSLAQQIVPLVQPFVQVDSVYILSDREQINQKLSTAYIKIKGIYTDIEALCNALRKIIRQLNNDLIPISIVPLSSGDNPDQLPTSFMYLQLFKECILTMQSDSKMEIQGFVDHFTSYYKDNNSNIDIIKQLKREYSQHLPIWWYTLPSFLYETLNAALRQFNVQHLMKMGFIIRDLHEQIKKLHSQPSNNKPISLVYRGLYFPTNELENLKKSENGLISFDQFLSTSTEKSVAMSFIPNKADKPDKTRVLFQIEIESFNSSVPFASIHEFSAISSENEILFSISTVCKIGKIKEIEDGLWEVNLTLVDERDPLLARLIEHMRVSLGNGNSWHRLGQLMIKMGQFKQAESIYKDLLEATSISDKTECSFLHNQLGYVFKQMNNLPEALSHYEKSLTIKQSYMSPTDSRLSSIYSNIGGIFKDLNRLDVALKFYQCVLKIDLGMSEPNPLEIAIDYNNIGSVFDEQGKYSEALHSYKEALEIKLDYLPPYHSSLATTYSNIALILRKMGSEAAERHQYESERSNYKEALSHYEKALNVQEKSLPTNHPSLVLTHDNIARLYKMQKNELKAIEHAAKADDIAKVAFGMDDPERKKRQHYLEELERTRSALVRRAGIVRK
ncbi:unnamed protein product [Rotaria socialis]|uniref:NAD(P)(+)--arginine ADP-ribosyltransferase n=1 Tax=Rotaria socialis TaxID=392032 RepID=A0A818HX51_9BILA|nr:unnamed protein product [Rotaria socialis]CAF4481235.1 unnamed protein product [Rotaria socialis]